MVLEQLVIIREAYGNMTWHRAALCLPTTSELPVFTHFIQDEKSLPGTFRSLNFSQK